jgi:hypothetical protein
VTRRNEPQRHREHREKTTQRKNKKEGTRNKKETFSGSWAFSFFFLVSLCFLALCSLCLCGSFLLRTRFPGKKVETRRAETRSVKDKLASVTGALLAAVGAAPT